MERQFTTEEEELGEPAERTTVGSDRTDSMYLCCTFLSHLSSHLKKKKKKLMGIADRGPAESAPTSEGQELKGNSTQVPHSREQCHSLKHDCSGDSPFSSHSTTINPLMPEDRQEDRLREQANNERGSSRPRSRKFSVTRFDRT